MNALSLDGDWQLFGFEAGSLGIHAPQDLRSAGLEPVAARVPGNVELDLTRAGKMEDPFFADNILKLRPYERYEWWYRRTFDFPAEYAGREWILRCDGLDTLATVWVNDVMVGEAENALVEHEFLVTPALRCGQENEIVIRLRSAALEARKFNYDAAIKSWEQREEGVFIRKPPHCWGWDIMPRAVSAGIWRSIGLVERPKDEIEQLYLWTVRAGADSAVLGVRYQIRTQYVDLSGIRLSFEGVCADSAFHFDWPIEFIAGGCDIRIPNAKLWWCRGYGEPNLYDLTVKLIRKTEAGEEALAERKERVGLRVVQVSRTPTSAPRKPFSGWADSRADVEPDPQHHFVISLNGVPVQIKGTNWVPLDAFHSRDLERTEAAIALADDINVNMIRCWGGNVYESDAFFNRCDELGFLVWQDFAFACCRYPQTDDFLAKARTEAEKVVRRLRNHPSLAVWSGDNEIDQIYFSDGLSPELNRISREVLPRTVHRLDPYRVYIPSSPHITPEAFAQRDAFTRTAEQHIWGPRGYFKSRFYSEHGAHFIGEVGYHGCVNPESARKFLSPEKLWPWQNNTEWNIHSVYHWQEMNITRDRIQLMANQIKELFGSIPESLEEFALASQITQAEAKKYFIESTRLRKWHTSGLLWWNLIDGWPQFSDAVVDYFYGKKLAYHYIRRVQQPICLIFGEEHDLRLPLIACNDSRDDAQITYRVWEAGQADNLLDGTFHLPANQNWCIASLRVFASDQRLLLMEWEVSGQKFGNHALLAAPPLDLEQYRAWLPEISALPRAF